MIDWVNAVIPYRHREPISGGVVISTDHDGAIEWQSSKKRTFEGSFESHGRIVTSHQHPMVDGEFTHIWISGSPKVVQGHNLFGTSDPRILAAHIARAALLTLGHESDEFTFQRWLSGRGMIFTVVDVTEMLDVGNELNAAQWIESAAEHTRVKYRGRGVAEKGTLYFGKRSRRWALKLYQKYTELHSRKKGHALPLSILMRDSLINYALGTVRAEFRFHSMQLKKMRLDDAANWNAATARELWETYMQSLDLSGQRPLHGSELTSLPSALRGTYSLWSDGKDMASLLSRATFYRHRKLLMPYGIDIALTRRATRSNVIPLLRTITAQPKGIPEWARNTPLLIAA